MATEKRKLPELLAPAGSPLALAAAIEGGADAVYMGGVAFNARINAKNFTPDELRAAISLAHSYGVKVYITANTLIFDKEREDLLRAAEDVYLMGADALIVADLGMAREIKKRIPIELHASTQLSGHSVSAAELLAQNGFSRMVCAREMSADDLAHFCAHSPIESEVFVHGALCVSTSGQCLFSSIVGGRSGNRGECAQPCRLPYSTGKGKQSYPLSLRDLSLAEHVTRLCDMGVSSFKIEGRMKAPEYVRDVTAVWRRLLDEGRNATAKEMAELASVFSRGGFTDGYFTKKTDRTMLGIRSESDKQRSAELVPFDKITKKLDISLSARLRLGEPASLCARLGERSVTVSGEIPQAAINAPLSREVVERNLSKLGNTPYRLASLSLELDGGIMMPISALNALRRAAVDALQEPCKRSEDELSRKPLDTPVGERRHLRTALFYDGAAVPEEAYSYFDRIYIPGEDFPRYGRAGMGIMLPEVIFDSQLSDVEAMIEKARELGAEDALVCNLGQVELAKRHGFSLHGDLRMNVTNRSTVAELERLGFEDVIASPELSLAQLRDLGGGSIAVVYGRLPLMLTEKCVGKELGGCEACESGRTALCDRRGVSFPVRKRYGHRSLVFNSVPVYMADREDELRRSRILGRHFIFTTESRAQAAAVIAAYKRGTPSADKNIRRVK